MFQVLSQYYQVTAEKWLCSSSVRLVWQNVPTMYYKCGVLSVACSLILTERKKFLVFMVNEVSAEVLQSLTYLH